MLQGKEEIIEVLAGNPNLAPESQKTNQRVSSAWGEIVVLVVVMVVEGGGGGGGGGERKYDDKYF
jgi:hypothetical protein